MFKLKSLTIFPLLIFSFLFISCKEKSTGANTNTNTAINTNADIKQQLDSIEQKQNEILTKLSAIESDQKQNEILAKLTAVEANQKEVAQLFKPRQPEVDLNKVYNIPIGNSPFKGKKTARVTITEFSDFQCPYCSKLQPVLKQVLEAYPDDVKLVFKNFPLSFHQQAMNAARAAHAAGDQGKYWEMHDIIFENFNNLSEAKFKEFAEKLNLDVERFMKDYGSGKYDKQIETDMKLGREISVGGTPTLFINGKRMSNRSFDDFKAAIEGYLKK